MRAAAELPTALILDPHDGGLVAARSLTRRGVPVTVLTNASSSWVARSRGVRGVVLPSLGGNEERWIEALADLGAAGEGVLLSCSDRVCALLAERRAEIPTTLRSFEAPDSAHMRLMDKATLYEAAEAAGVRYPWRRELRTEADLADAQQTAEFPCVLKPVLSHQWRPLFGDERVFVIDSPAALAERAGPAIAAGLSVLITEHVPGPETSLEGHVVVRLADGSYPVEYMRQKVRQFPVGFGAGALVVSHESSRTRELARTLLEAAGFVGIASVEAKIHAGTGEAVLIEVNVRIPQNFGLGEAAGADASYRTYAALAGLPLGPRPVPREGARSIVPRLEARAVLELRRRGELGLGEWLRSYRGIRDVGVLDPRDPGPGLALASRLVRSRLGR